MAWRPAGGRATLRPGYNVVAADGAALRRLLEALLHPDPRDAGGAVARPGRARHRAGARRPDAGRRRPRHLPAGARLRRRLPAPPLRSREARLRAGVAGPGRDRRPAAQPHRRPVAGAAGGAALAGRSPSCPPGPAAASATSPAPAGAGPPRAERASRPASGSRSCAAELERARIAEKLQEQLDALPVAPLQAGGGAQERAAGEGGAGRRRGRARRAGAGGGGGGLAGRRRRPGSAAFEKSAARRAEAEAPHRRRAGGHRRGPGPGRAGAGLEDAAVPGRRGGRAGRCWWPAWWPGSSDLRYLALLDIPAFGWSAWLALRWIDAQEAWERIGRRGQVVDDLGGQGRGAVRPRRRGGATARSRPSGSPSRPSSRTRWSGWPAPSQARGRGPAAAGRSGRPTPRPPTRVAEQRQVEEAMRAVETRLSEQAGRLRARRPDGGGRAGAGGGRGGGAAAGRRRRPRRRRRARPVPRRLGGRAAAGPAGAGGGRAGRQPGLGGARAWRPRPRRPWPASPSTGSPG